uniref:Uncharacterized protein n=1 Tax=Anopheles dirus TaxID=7168 RepID=A0A182N9B4_9DIPT
MWSKMLSFKVAPVLGPETVVVRKVLTGRFLVPAALPPAGRRPFCPVRLEWTLPVGRGVVVDAVGQWFTVAIVIVRCASSPSSSPGWPSSACESPDPERESASLRYVFSGLLLMSSLLSGLCISVSMLDPSVGSSSSSSSSTCSSWTVSSSTSSSSSSSSSSDTTDSRPTTTTTTTTTTTVATIILTAVLVRFVVDQLLPERNPALSARMLPRRWRCRDGKRFLHQQQSRIQAQIRFETVSSATIVLSAYLAVLLMENSETLDN